MTHDELLAKIDKTQKMYLDWDEENGFTHEPNDFLQALRAVVELQGKGESLLHTGVKNYADGYNQALADVRQAIEEQLK